MKGNANRAAGIATVGIVMAALAVGAHAATDDVELASRATGVNGQNANAGALGWALSADGRRVAFESNATNLDPADTDAQSDVFVRDLDAETLVLASRAPGATGASSNGHSFHAALSGDGRFVSFTSSATNLHPDAAVNVPQIFVRDLETHALVLASRAAGADGAPANDGAGVSSISGDGRFVAFLSRAANLHPDDTDAETDIFLRDLQTNALTLVSRADGADGADGNDDSYAPEVSRDGRFVTFESRSTNLHPDDPEAGSDVYVRDLLTDTLTLVSRAGGAGGAKGNGHSSVASVSADGRFVSFQSQSTNLHPDDADAGTDVFVRDLQTNTLMLVSRGPGATGATGNSDSRQASISADGRFVAFASAATNLHPDGVGSVEEVYLRDLHEHTLMLVSRAAGAGGAAANAFSSSPAVSAHGEFVSFISGATNLHPDDTDPQIDVFVREMPPPPQPEPEPTPTPTPTPSPSPTITPPAPGACANGVDDDRDGWTDASDPQCRAGRGQEHPVDNPVLTCAGAELVLIDVLPEGRRVRLAGYAALGLAGREVLLYAGTRRVARARVAVDGSFSATSLRRPGRYSARIGDIRSRALKLERKTVGATITHRDGIVTLSARTLARKRRAGRVELLLRRPGACGAHDVVASKKLPRSGRFSISAAAPPGAAVAVYRARIRLRGQTTYTLPRVIFLR